MGNKLNLLGRKFGKLLVVKELTERNNWGSIMWRCKCDCGNETIVNGVSLRNGDIKSCGCYQKEVASKHISLVGQRFGRLLVLEDLGKIKNTKRYYYRCKCDCGKEKNIASDGLKSGRSKSCGCYNRERVIETHTTHGMSNTKAYKCNDAMKRSNNKTRLSKYLTEDEQRLILYYYYISEQLGSDWEVDHIQPISKGGLHHPDNLQIIPKYYNRIKSNKINFNIPKGLVIRL